MRNRKHKPVDNVPKRKWREARNKEIKKLHRAKWSNREIAAKIGLSSTAVFYIINGRNKK